MRILYLIPSLGDSGASKQLELVAQGLARKNVELLVCQLGPGGAKSKALEKTGIPVHSLHWQRSFDPAALWSFHKLLKDYQPDLLHVWQTSSLRTLALVGRSYLSRVVLSQPFAWHRGGKLHSVDRWLLRKVARIVVHGEAEVRLGQEQGLFLEKIAVIPPGISGNPQIARKEGNSAATKIVCVGPLAVHKGYRDALWAFDILRYLFPSLQLTFLGKGPEREPLERFARGLECHEAVHFAGPFAQVEEYLHQADLCWVPSRHGGGTQTTLEAMLAGLPVIACQVPNLHGLIVDNQTGFVIPPEDKVGLARRTRLLLRQPELAARLGTQARERALDHFSAARLVERCHHVYQEVAA